MDKQICGVLPNCIVLLLFLPCMISLSFNISTFTPNTQNIIFANDSFASHGVIQLTKNQLDSEITSSVGRAMYSEPLLLWDSSSKQVTDFTTHFSFVIKLENTASTNYGDGICFFLAPVGSSAPNDSAGGYLGLVSAESNNISSKNKFVAVEFDSFQNSWDPNDNHVGINVNSIVSAANVTWTSSIKNGSTANAWVTYHSSTKNLSVFLTYADNPVFNGSSSLSYIIDLSTVLPERVEVGFSAATGSLVEIHNILSWDFNSTLREKPISIPKPPTPSKVKLIAGIVGGICVLLIVSGLLGLIWCRRRSRENADEIYEFDVDAEDDFEKGTGPRRFTYSELSRATRNFSEDGKLGQGGFGGVYLGSLNDGTEIAVKKIARGSKQGKKEYVSEVKTISRLKHRNLVQLLGWCHERGELLLVYEFMSNGSLDFHLYAGDKVALPWPERHKVAHGLASALRYLHEEWEQCVVHRDIKSSNVMLDSTFNAKLGDFGLARLIDHGLGSQTTVLAGTLGYMAPECLTTGKASKESDVYSFGMVALEIACGRRPVEPKEEPNKVRMLEWVWSLYGEGLLFEAVDRRLEGEFDVQQMERLMVVGLWCCHPDYSFRPSIRQVLNVLNRDSPLPGLPSKFPVAVYFPPMNMDVLAHAYSSGFTSSTGTSSSTSTSQSALSGVALLLSHNAHV